MKKEFKAPIVETKQLSTLNDVMAGVFAASYEGPDNLVTMKDDPAEGFKQWKGFSK